MLISVVCLYSCTSTSEKASSVLNYEKSDNDYALLVNKIKNQDAQGSDYDSLINVFPLTSRYDPKSDEEQRAKLLSQTYMQSQQWRQCVSTNNQLLDINYTSLTGHYGLAMCAAELGNIAVGKFHNTVLDNFIEAIWRTGSGQTPESPFYITSVNDLYAFIQLHQLIAVGQSLSYVDNLPIQAIQVQNPETSRTFTWYFNVTPQFRRGVIDELESAK
ncbi:MAG: hypothetical protein ACJAVV_003168 [Alphaproteobacteria bacterium]